LYFNCPPVSSKWNVQSVLLLHGKDIHHRIHHKVMQELASLPDLVNWGQPTVQLLQGSHQGLFLNDHHFYLQLSVVASEANKTNTTSQKEGEVGALSGLLSTSPLKYLQGLDPWPKTKQGGRMDLRQCLYRQGVPSSQCSSA